MFLKKINIFFLNIQNKQIEQFSKGLKRTMWVCGQRKQEKWKYILISVHIITIEMVLSNQILLILTTD